jgi:hypothetical protein
VSRRCDKSPRKGYAWRGHAAARADAALASNQNIENNPMQSSMVVAGMDALSYPCKKHFDTSGKSGALFHHRAICKTPMALLSSGLFGAIARKKPLPTIEVAAARYGE